jgi:hypothetical protein
VSESFADDFDPDAGFQGERGVGVVEVVEPDAGERRPGDQFLECVGHDVRMDRSSVVMAEHVVVVLATRCDRRVDGDVL